MRPLARYRREQPPMPSIVAIQNGVAITVNDIVTGDGIAVVQFNGKANGRTGMPYNNEYVHVLRYRDDKICSITEFLDTNLFYKLLEQ
tara:strand:+ start:180 stop:443 length:264 start_codon:yes stop_codon:yes gene_type:complete